MLIADSARKLTIAADARLDDRVTLSRSLNLTAEDSSDTDLILAAYLRWGRDCPEQLLGDFAFAIWDEERRDLFCARDVFGVVPLYYCHDREGLAFGTQLSPLSRQGDALNHGRIASYLAGLDDSPDETVYTAIRRLPAGHWLRWSGNDRTVGRYATIAPETTPIGEDYADGIRRRFLAAVDDRTRATPNIGAMLSGGLDSSSIVAAATRQGGTPLRTFSFSYRRGSRFDETDYVKAVIDRCAVVPDFVTMDDLAPLSGLNDLASGTDDLVFGPGLPKIAQLLGRARKAGVHVMLDGHGGDEVLSHGFGRLNQLARQRRWRTLYRELRGVSAISGESAVGLFLKFFASHGAVARARKWLGSKQASETSGSSPVLSRDFARATDIGARIEQWAGDYARATSSESSLHAWNLTSPSVAAAFEALRRVSDQVGVTLRFPFYDRRLVEYALSVPDAEKLRDGWTRHVMREAMAGMLPEAVRWRRTKVDFGNELAVGLARHHAAFLTDMLRPSAPLAGFVDLAAAQDNLNRLLSDPVNVSGYDLLALWRMAYLTLWLSNRRAAIQPAMVTT
jgi:asparagine synthase (glutamine-hydrolysing)